MSKSSSILVTIKFWYLERKGFLFALMFPLAFCLLLLYTFVPRNTEQVTGIVHSQTYVGGIGRYRLILFVKLDYGALVHLSSPSEINVGTELCLYKTTNHAGKDHYSIKSTGKCT